MRPFRRSALKAALAAGALVAAAACGAPEDSATDEVQTEPAPAVSAEDAARMTALAARLDALEAEITRAEDVSAIKRLMRTYGFYLDRGLWADLTELFTDDAVGNYPAGVFIGKESLAPHFLDNNGRGYIGFEEGRLGNHIPLQPVITVHDDGTAEGRWHALAQLGQYGTTAFWAGGVYEIDYRKEDDVWKIARLDYYDTFSAPADVGWGAPPPENAPQNAPSPRPGASRFANLPRPPDAPRDREGCPGFPGACIPPFHYANPVSGAAFVSPLEAEE